MLPNVTSTYPTGNTAVKDMLRICKGASPDNAARNGFDELILELMDNHNMQDADDYQKVIARLAFVLLDGLQFGNWPKAVEDR